ncbi:MAG: glycoside hydrolase family 2 [Salana multivorans]|uniref:sugar-binding domain-containing protein n=1 Tax=Salana multivorans TaxID=120377 RepID=UPI0009685C9B|nr:sugar-binding domain-containing protein [Salana multivorans]MBN8883547.1 glycoside hydrolase family 2 [Salana multivorans]OJX94003.1 MAG: hypothetical protein BGO96_09280 [Micrococcales bacterium 73-15]
MSPSPTPVPRPEYPRPDLDRSERWLALNGTWELQPDESGTLAPDGPADLPDRLASRITVPFAWSSEASGVHEPWLATAWYRRTVTVPDGWGADRVFLCFGAVHHEARVWVNGRLLAEHVGGYLPFDVDVTDALDADRAAEIVVRVHAPLDKRDLPHGKQRSLPSDDYDSVSFSPTSGIWQSVWLEPRAATHAAAVVAGGDSLTGFDVVVHVAGPRRADARVTIAWDPEAAADAGEAVASAVAAPVPVSGSTDDDGTARLRLDTPGAAPWHPDAPVLHRLRVTTESSDGVDRVTTWAGLRRVETRDGALWLNGERLYVRGVLDQGYWPRTGMTAPSDDALRHDLELAARAGFNLVRKHIKLEEPRWLHHADRLGMLVWAEPPSPGRHSAQGAAAFEEVAAGMVRRDGSHPAIVVWGLYNEEWGYDFGLHREPAWQDELAGLVARFRALDPTRPVVDNSGWHHVDTDLVDWHCYITDLPTWAEVTAGLTNGTRGSFPVPFPSGLWHERALHVEPRRVPPGAPVLNSEYGTGHTTVDRAWAMQWQTQELRRHDAGSGYVYCELTDVEHENAGIHFADRSLKDTGGLASSDVHAPTTLVVDVLPAAPGADIDPDRWPDALPVHVSHHGTRRLTGRLRARWTRPRGTVGAGLGDGAGVVDGPAMAVEPFVLSAPVALPVPRPDGPARLLVWFEGDDGTSHARAVVDAGSIERSEER